MQTQVIVEGKILTHEEAAAAAAAKSLQLCLTLCDPMDGSPPGSPVPGILQARTLECVAISARDVPGWTRSLDSGHSDAQSSVFGLKSSHRLGWLAQGQTPGEIFTEAESDPPRASRYF